MRKEFEALSPSFVATTIGSARSKAILTEFVPP
jgi:hypothetical protein